MLLSTPATDSEAAIGETLRTRHTSDGIVRIVDNTALIARNEVSIEPYVRSYFADMPVLARIAWCESKFQHFDENGDLVRGDITPEDVGVMQINEYFHGKTARVLGLDLTALDDNLAYARYLFEREGTAPWAASRHCWNATEHIALR